MTNNPRFCSVFDRASKGVGVTAQNRSQNRRQALQSTSVDIFKSNQSIANEKYQSQADRCLAGITETL